MDDVRASNRLLERVAACAPAEKILLLLPVLETRLGTTQTQRLANAFALRKDVPLESNTDLRSFSSLLSSFLHKHEKRNWDEAWRSAPNFWLCRDNPLTRPHDPHTHRLRGPTRDQQRLSARHDIPSPFLILHFSWSFLSVRDRVAVVASHPTMRDYAQLRSSAANRTVTSLRLARPKPLDITPLCHRRAWILSCALIRFDFVYADLIRWLGGEYTNDHRDWSSVFQLADFIARVPVPIGNPPIDIERAVIVATSGAPIAGHHECAFLDVAKREEYDNHPPLRQVTDEVRKKFAKEERLSYQIALPRFLWAFIYGLFISPITFVVRRPGEEGRICPDPSNKIHEDDTGAANDSIPDAGLPGAEDENPPVYYGSAFVRFLKWIYNLRIAKPFADILAHVDDISAAYHRILYHPMMGVVFAQAFKEFIMIPCGLIFGAKDSPSWYMIPAELRAHIASAADFRNVSNELADELILPPPLTPREASKLTRATADSRNTGQMHLELPFRHDSFVDDTVAAAWREQIRQAVKQSVLSAYVMFGFPAENRRPPPLNPDKWEHSASAVVKYLGFIIDTRQMLVIWPVEKRIQLAKLLDEIWLDPKVPRATPKQASQLLGLIRHGGLVCHLGIYLSLRLQFELNDFLSKGTKKAKSWWSRFRFNISGGIRAELRLLRHTLDDTFYHPAWCKQIFLIIPREVNTIPVSDASYEGIGGYCRAFRFFWRLSAQDLRHCGWKLSGDGAVPEPNFTPKTADDEAHINLLEFAAIIINAWMLLKIMTAKSSALPNEHVIARFLAENTSVLSWLSHAGRTKRVGPAHPGHHKQRSRSSVSLLRSSVLGISYQRRIPRLSESVTLPSAAKTAYDRMVYSFKSADRGHVRASNDKSVESRAKNFTVWLEGIGFDDKSLTKWDSATAIAMISAFVLHVAEGGIYGSKTTLSAKTLNEYAKAAEAWCVAALQLDLRGTLGEKGVIHPFIAEVIAQRRAWDKPRSKKEPITMDMFDNAQHFVSNQIKKDRVAFLSRPAAVHDFACLCTFTGSRAGEYAQTKAKRGSFNRIPLSADAGEWAGMPLAFIRSDFTFWADDGTEINKNDLGRVRKQASDVYIRFRYDKSLNNFTIRKFKRTGHPFLCPILTSTSIIYRANLLGVPALEPIGVFKLQKRKSSGYTFLTNNDVTAELWNTCLRTYPDSSHYMNINYKCIMAHSGRVTAAVALYTAGQTFETIAFRLRWSVQSVQHYIRERCQHIGDLCQAVLTGAGRI